MLRQELTRSDSGIWLMCQVLRQLFALRQLPFMFLLNPCGGESLVVGHPPVPVLRLLWDNLGTTLARLRDYMVTTLGPTRGHLSEHNPALCPHNAIFKESAPKMKKV